MIWIFFFYFYLFMFYNIIKTNQFCVFNPFFIRYVYISVPNHLSILIHYIHNLDGYSL